MRTYIAGPVAGHENLNAKSFERAARALRDLGHEPVNPLEVTPVDHGEAACPDYGYFPGENVHGHTSSVCFMRTDLEALLACEAIYLLDGWQTSRGAIVEAAVARAVGIPRMRLGESWQLEETPIPIVLGGSKDET